MDDQLNEARLRLITDNIMDMVALVDRKGVFRYVSPSHKIILGYELDFFLGKSLLDLAYLCHPDDIGRLMNIKNLRNIDQKGEYRFRHRDGHYLWLQSLGNLVYDENYSLSGAVFSTRDITDIKLANEELHRTALELSAVFQALPDLYFRMSADGTFLEIQAGSDYDLFRPKEEIIGKKIQDVADKNMAKQFQHSIDKALRTRSLVIINYNHTIKKEMRYFEARFLPLLEDQVIVVVQNITESWQAEQELALREAALKKRDEEYSKIVEVASEGIWRLDAESKISFSNQKMAEMLGYDVAEITGRSYFSFIDDEWVNIAKENIARRMQGFTGKYELKMLCKDGKDIWMNVSGAPLLEEDGSYAGSFAFFTNITYRKQIEQLLQKSHEEEK